MYLVPENLREGGGAKGLSGQATRKELVLRLPVLSRPFRGK